MTIAFHNHRFFLEASVKKYQQGICRIALPESLHIVDEVELWMKLRRQEVLLIISAGS